MDLNGVAWCSANHLECSGSPLTVHSAQLLTVQHIWDVHIFVIVWMKVSLESAIGESVSLQSHKALVWIIFNNIISRCRLSGLVFNLLTTWWWHNEWNIRPQTVVSYATCRSCRDVPFPSHLASFLIGDLNPWFSITTWLNTKESSAHLHWCEFVHHNSDFWKHKKLWRLHSHD